MSHTVENIGSEARIAPQDSHPENCPKWNKNDTVWMLSLFGTAIGAGVLFLPINAGIGGIIPIIVMAVLALPMAFWAHRALARFVLSGSDPEGDITVVVGEHFGPKAGAAMTVLYFLSIYPILLVYSVTMTNTVNSFLENQLGVDPWPRWLMSLVLISGLILIVSLGQKAVTSVMSILVFPFIAVLVILSIMLIPKWNGAFLETFDPQVAAQSSGQGIALTLLLLVPVLVFSFNHSPIISSFAVDSRRNYGPWADRKVNQVLLAAEALMVVVVMFFILSTTLSLSPADLAEAKAQNITILSYLANHFDSPLIQWVAPIVAMVAVAKSFLGHYLGAAEGFEGIVVKASKGKLTRNKALSIATLIFMLVSAWLVAWADPSVLGMIETMCGPTIAIILFIMPIIAIMKVPALKKLRGHISNYFTLGIGIIAFGTIFYNIFQLF
ncbi:aromatic amino acid transport family protein [Corynebacterium sp.]|uniref:aromatic amino acid transport family protein n=1 Tax=Corynebacterium sp. TaxID=1720 RepID=UPI0026DC13C6|nr:aromatic amino acid transport family protein [Corynebacterium sp.]MDO5033100.1 aromatic amino acid transport family protein [Corynebacterium sp.]